MTVQTTTLRADYTGNGSTTAFTIPFYFLDNSHVKVIRTQISTGVATTLALTTDYTVTGAGVGTGGTVTMVTAPTTDQKISVLRNMPFTQLAHYVPNDPFPAATHEAVVDQLKMDVQQLNEGSSRALSLSENSSGVSATLPTPTGSNVIGWNSAATALQNYAPTDFTASIAYSVYRTDLFSGTGAQTAFTLSNDPGSVNNCDVAIAGVTQRPGTDFTVSGKVLTFTSAPASGTNNVCVRYANALTAIPAGAYSGSSRTVPVSYAYAATVTVDAALSNVFYIGTLTGNTILAINNPSDGQTINIRFVQDTTGGRTVTLPGTASVVGTLVTTASYVDWLTLTYVASSSRWEGCWANATTSPTAVGTALITAVDAAAARTAIGATATGSSVITAATQQAARTALGANAFSVTLSASSVQTSGSAGQMFFDTKDFDTGNYFNTASNRYIPQIPGKYLFSASIGWNNTTGGAVSTQLRKNGATVKQATENMTATVTATTTVTAVLDMNGSTDYVEVWGLQSTGANFAPQSSALLTYFSGALIA